MSMQGPLSAQFTSLQRAIVPSLQAPTFQRHCGSGTMLAAQRCCGIASTSGQPSVSIAAAPRSSSWRHGSSGRRATPRPARAVQQLEQLAPPAIDGDHDEESLFCGTEGKHGAAGGTTRRRQPPPLPPGSGAALVSTKSSAYGWVQTAAACATHVEPTVNRHAVQLVPSTGQVMSRPAPANANGKTFHIKTMGCQVRRLGGADGCCSM